MRIDRDMDTKQCDNMGELGASLHGSMRGDSDHTRSRMLALWLFSMRGDSHHTRSHMLALLLFTRFRANWAERAQPGAGRAAWLACVSLARAAYAVQTACVAACPTNDSLGIEAHSAAWLAALLSATAAVSSWAIPY